MNFKKWVKSIQTAGYNGARTVIEFSFDFSLINERMHHSEKNDLICN